VLFCFAVVFAGIACSVDALDLSGKKCPCTGGWVCDTAVGQCVPDGTPIEVHEAGVPDVRIDGPAPVDAGGAILVENLLPTWSTANGIRWDWQASGDPADFASYEIVIGPSAEAVRSRGTGSHVYDATTNPELGSFGGRDPKPAMIPVSLFTITDGLPDMSNAQVFAQVVAHDKKGGITVTEVLNKTTFHPTRELDLLDDVLPEGGTGSVMPAGAKMVTENPFPPSTKCFENTTACGTAASCALGVGVTDSTGGYITGTFDSTDFPNAFFEIAIRGGITASTYADVVLITGDACGGPCRFRFTGVSFGRTTDEWRLVQVPLRFLKQNGTGTPLTYSTLKANVHLSGFLVTGDMPDGVKIGVDQVRVRW